MNPTTRIRPVWLWALLALGGLGFGGYRLGATPGGPLPSPVPPTKAEGEADGGGPARAFLAANCLGCHGAEKPKGDFRLDNLAADFTDPAAVEKWQAAVRRVRAGEMPPKSRPRPAEGEVKSFTEWVGQQLDVASAASRAEGRTVLRRLNRVEYENTLRDLLGVPVNVRDLLPEDGAAAGFDNVGAALHVSSFLLERYLEAADKALGLAIANGPRPPLVQKRYDLRDERHVKVTTEKVFRKPDDALVFFSSSAWQAVTVGKFYPPDRGTYRFRISASAVQSGGKPVTFGVWAGLMLMAGKTHLVGYFDAPPEKPAVFEFTDHLEARNTIRILPYGLASAQAVNKIGADAYAGPGLAVQWVEVEGPLHDTWPPESHRRLFGDLPQKPAPVYNNRSRVEVVSDDPEADAATILRDFARRAFRRPVTDADVAPFLGLVRAKLADGYSFEQAVRVGLSGVLVSPHFLFLGERPGRLDDFALASRLSYFLWSTMPDEELLALAERGELARPETLRRQVERLLRDPKAAAFTRNFVSQWLNLREIDATTPSHILYPEYDEMLKESMLREAYLFFEEVLKGDLSLTNFVASDFTMLNGRLARHYGVPGPEGWEFRKVALPPDSHRGGVLTMAAVLKVTANGTYTSPILRGVWVLDRILGTPPSPPPAGVPAVEPDIRGATTLRQQLVKHRQDVACASCHARIDPPGFALESFDVIGGWRDHYRTSGNGKPVTIDGRKMNYRQGLPVDPADALADGRRFRDIDEFRQLLLADRDQLARALATRLLTYATGAAPQPGDGPQIEAIVAAIRGREYGLRSLVHAVVQSELFRRK